MQYIRAGAGSAGHPWDGRVKFRGSGGPQQPGSANWSLSRKGRVPLREAAWHRVSEPSTGWQKHLQGQEVQTMGGCLHTKGLIQHVNIF